MVRPHEHHRMSGDGKVELVDIWGAFALSVIEDDRKEKGA